MSNLENIDDELLSAYLDDELAPEERARVEARLAADPAARQLLAELRGVSQAMKGLPTESLGGDLRETVLRRAERAMLVSNPPTASDEHAASWKETLARIPIGHTRRGWFWVCMTIAAGLFVMIFDRGADENGNVAVRAPKSATAPSTSHEPLSDLELHALPSAAIPSLAQSDSDRLTTPAEKSAAVEMRAGEPSSDDSGAVASRVADPYSALPKSLPQSPAPPATVMDAMKSVADEAETVSGDLVVVHVNMKPEALRRKAFDAVLENQGIMFDQPADGVLASDARNGGPTAGGGGGAVGGEVEGLRTNSTAAPAPAAVPGNAANVLSDNKSDLAAGARLDVQARGEAGKDASEADVDVVLVEAPMSQVLSCMSVIDADRENYLGIAVDDEPASANSVTQKIAVDKSRDANWSQFNRGMEPAQQKVQLAPDNNYYYSTGRGQVVVNRARSIGEEQKSENFDRSLTDAKSKIANQSRALRIEPQQQQLGFGLAGGKLEEKQVLGRRAMNRAAAPSNEPQAQEVAAGFGGAATTDDNVQVLFVLQAGEEAAPAEVPAKE